MRYTGRVHRRLPLILATAVLVACSGDGAAVSRPTTIAPGGVAANAVIVSVVDGDTVQVDIDGRREKLRLIGIDTPETVKPNTPVECFGPQASDFTKGLLPEGTAVRIERDVEARDAYDRLLGYVYRADDGLFVTLELVAQGYALLLTFPPNVAHVDEFVAAARAAEQADLGLWGACTG
jgi:micrococcal nuclease